MSHQFYAEAIDQVFCWLCGKIPKMDDVFNENACYNDYFVTAYYTTLHQPPHAWQQQQRQRQNLHDVAPAQDQ